MNPQVDVHKILVELISRSTSHDWTQARLARRLRITPKHMNLVWNAKVQPNLELLEDWARLFDLKLEVEVHLVQIHAGPKGKVVA